MILCSNRVDASFIFFHLSSSRFFHLRRGLLPIRRQCILRHRRHSRDARFVGVLQLSPDLQSQSGATGVPSGGERGQRRRSRGERCC